MSSIIPLRLALASINNLNNLRRYLHSDRVTEVAGLVRGAEDDVSMIARLVVE